jgi:hypothetical protein
LKAFDEVNKQNVLLFPTLIILVLQTQRFCFIENAFILSVLNNKYIFREINAHKIQWYVRESITLPEVITDQ